MYSDKPHIHRLITALPAVGLRDVVVTAGSRNAPIVHDLHEAGYRLHPAIDERSAGFMAIGIHLAVYAPVAVCVTSGSALLALLPAAAEAYYRGLPIVFVSADRPAEWIDQLDGQTLPQTDALLPYAPTYTLDSSAATGLQESLALLYREGGRPIHINVPIAEPLFRFVTPGLPSAAPLVIPRPKVCDAPLTEAWLRRFAAATSPAVVIGHSDAADLRPAVALLRQCPEVTVYADINSGVADDGRYADFEANRRQEVAHDIVLHVGGAFVGKYLKLALRARAAADLLTVVRVDATEACPNTFAAADYHKLQGSPAAALRQLSTLWSPSAPAPFVPHYAPVGDGFARSLERLGRGLAALHASGQPLALFLANSRAPRVALNGNLLPREAFPIYLNRGVNGIEGVSSTAAGYALASDDLTVLVTGDLSFFYDVNALWNDRLRGNLRILLLNDGRGGIFASLPGLADSPVGGDIVAGRHSAQARGVAESYGCRYLSATGAASEAALHALLTDDSTRPVLLEVLL